MVLVGMPLSCHSKSDALCNLFKNQMSSARNPSRQHSKADALCHCLKSVRNNVNIIWYNNLPVRYPHPECILMLKGILEGHTDDVQTSSCIFESATMWLASTSSMG